jgi:hypothetical protein
MQGERRMSRSDRLDGPITEHGEDVLAEPALEVGPGAVAQVRCRRLPCLDVLGQGNPAGARIDPVAGTDLCLNGGQVSPSGGLRVEGLRPLVTEWVSEASFPAVGARRSTDRAHDASSAVRRPARRHRAKWLPEEASTVDERFHPGGLEPAGDLVGIEAYAPSPAEVGDAALVDEPADVTVRHAEVLSELRDVDQVRKVLGFPISLLATSLRNADLSGGRYTRQTPAGGSDRGGRQADGPAPAGVRP